MRMSMTTGRACSSKLGRLKRRQAWPGMFIGSSRWQRVDDGSVGRSADKESFEGNMLIASQEGHWTRSE